MLLDIAQLILGTGLLWFGADFIVDSAAAVARRFNVSELVIGLTVVAFGTSAPEFLVTITAAFKGLSDISVANVAGSNLANLGLILGLVAMIKAVPANRTILLRDGGVLLVVTVLSALLALGDVLGRFSGLVLFTMLVGYLGLLFVKREGLPGEDDGEEQRVATWQDYPKLAAGFLGIALGSNLLVDSAQSIAMALGISEWIIGLTLVAFGTSLPELVTCLAASLRGCNQMLLGNLVGSNVFNLAGVLGLTCLIKPVAPSPEAVINLALLVPFTVLVLACLRTGWRVSRVEGGIPFGVNLLLWVRGLL